MWFYSLVNIDLTYFKMVNDYYVYKSNINMRTLAQRIKNSQHYVDPSLIDKQSSYQLDGKEHSRFLKATM